MFHKAKSLHLIKPPLPPISFIPKVRCRRQNRGSTFALVGNLAVLLAIRAPTAWTTALEQESKFTGEMESWWIGKSLHHISKDIRIREKTANGISKLINSSIVLTFTVSCQSHWLLKCCCSSLYCFGFVLQRRLFDNRIISLKRQKKSAYRK